MSGLPGGYKHWCDSQGINPFHPDMWTPDELAKFYAWKLSVFKLSWALMKRLGVKDYMTPAQIRSMVREHRDMLEAPPPSRPWTTCPCHSFAPRQAARDTAPHGLAWMAQKFGRKA